jgi:CBS domain containing-hemolysin-like protein
VVVDARVTLEELTTTLGLVFSAEDLAEDVDTVGGLLATLVGRVPVRGEIIAHNGLDFEILDADPRRIKRLRLHIRTTERETDATPPKQAAPKGQEAADQQRAGSDKSVSS